MSPTSIAPPNPSDASPATGATRDGDRPDGVPGSAGIVVEDCPACDLTNAVSCPACNATGLLVVRTAS